MLPRDRIPPVCVFAVKPHDTKSPWYLVPRCERIERARALSRVLLTSFSETGAKSAWRCVLKHLPPSQPEPRIFCMTSDSRNTTFVIECCNKEDFCNRDLKPLLHPSNNEGIVQTDLEVTKTLQVARALAAILLLLTFFSFFFFFPLYVSISATRLVKVPSRCILNLEFYSWVSLPTYAEMHNEFENSTFLESTAFNLIKRLIVRFIYEPNVQDVIYLTIMRVI